MLLAAALVPPLASAAGLARVSIIIDDLGNQWDSGTRAVNLPGPVTLSFLPRTPFARHLAERAHSAGKEVMLHLPMEAVAHLRLGPGGVTADMTRAQFLHTVAGDLASLPYVQGVNNHMGSLLTRHPSQMDWLMAALRAHGGLYFVDSRTTPATVAAEIAAQHHIPTTSRDVFLDNRRDPGAIHAQFMEMIRRAREEGVAVAIGHPYPETLAVLEQMVPKLPGYGLELLSVSKLLEDEQQRRPKLWRASLSPSPTAVKSSKP